MKKYLLNMDRLPTLEELKEFFKNNDWTTAKIDDPAQRTPEEQAEIEYAAKLMDKLPTLFEMKGAGFFMPKFKERPANKSQEVK